MSNVIRFDGRPLVCDERGAVPTYVVEDNDEGIAVMVNQFSGESEVIGPRPYDGEDMWRAFRALRKKQRQREKIYDA